LKSSFPEPLAHKLHGSWHLGADQRARRCRADELAALQGDQGNTARPIAFPGSGGQRKQQVTKLGLSRPPCRCVTGTISVGDIRPS
jgi:hypothetical protein